MTYPTAYRSGLGAEYAFFNLEGRRFSTNVEERQGFQMPFYPNPLVGIPVDLPPPPGEERPRRVPPRYRPQRPQRPGDRTREIGRELQRRRREKALRDARRRARNAVRNPAVIGKAFARFHPWVRAAGMAFDAYQALQSVVPLSTEQGGHQDPDPAVWNLTGDCGVSGGRMVYRYGQVNYNPCTVDGAGNFGGACGAAPSFGSTHQGPDFGACVWNAGVFTLTEWMLVQDPVPGWTDLATGVRSRSWTAPGPSAPYVPQVAPTPAIWVEPAYVPSLSPEALPIGQPVRQPDPWPNTRPADRGQQRTLPRTRTIGMPFPALQVSPQPRPAPGVVIEVPHPDDVAPLEPPVVRETPPPTDEPRPPDKRTKERKVHLMVRGFPAAVINAATEGLDYVDALYKALPEEIRRKYRRPGIRATQWERMVALWHGWHLLDAEEALSAVVTNAIEDAFYGGVLGRAIGAASRRAGMSTGLEWGLAHDQTTGNRAFVDAYNEKYGTTYEASTLELPEVDFEDEDGFTVITWGPYSFRF